MNFNPSKAPGSVTARMMTMSSIIAIFDAAADDEVTDSDKEHSRTDGQGLVTEHIGKRLCAGDAGQGKYPNQLGKVEAHILDTIGA